MDGAAIDPKLQVPVKEIQRLKYPDEISPELFEEFAAKSEPVIIEGLIADWPAFADAERNWQKSRWDDLLRDEVLDVGFDPADSRMMHFGDDSGEPEVLFNPGRLRLPAWAFREVALLRQEILRLREEEGRVDLAKHENLRRRLACEVSVQNVPFLAVDADSPLHFFAPLECKIRDLVPLSFYLSHDTYALPTEMQKDLGPQAPKLIAGWASPNSSRIWATNGPPWRVPYPPWSEKTVPEPGQDTMIYSCFHCDRMENFHSLLAGEKQVVLVPPGQHDVLNSTRYATQRQWLLAPVSATSQRYLGSTLFTSKQTECTSDQSAVHPFRPAEANRKVSRGQWPDRVDFPVRRGTLRKGDTLYIPAYHWHWVATSTPPSLGIQDEGPLALSVNFWWWPIHNDKAMEDWSFQNESFRNARIPLPKDKPLPDRAAHAVSFYQLTARQRQEASVPRPWPSGNGVAPKDRSHLDTESDESIRSVGCSEEQQVRPGVRAGGLGRLAGCCQFRSCGKKVTKSLLRVQSGTIPLWTVSLRELLAVFVQRKEAKFKLDTEACTGPQAQMLITSNSTSPANSRATGVVAPVLRRLGPSSYLESEISGPGGDGAMPRSARGRRSQSRGLAALAWLSQRWEALVAWWQDSRPPGEVLELVYVGGAMLRESCELNSAEVAVVHCGERVLLLQEVGRRARVRTVDGFIGWISLYTADNVAIARKVSRDVQHSFKDRGRASFREEFEQKWRRLRVDPGSPEGRIHALRQSAGRVPISEWRPSGMPGAPSPQRTPPVPRLSPPSSTPQKDNTPAAASSSGGATVVARPMEDLLDLSEEKEPPSSQRSRVPDLAEVLSAAAGSSPPTYRELCATDGDGDATASSGIPEAPPSREKPGLVTWGEEPEALLSQLPSFEQLLDQQPDETQAELSFASYEMEEEANVDADEVNLIVAESLPKLEELDPLAKAKSKIDILEMPKEGSGMLASHSGAETLGASPDKVAMDLLSFEPAECSPAGTDLRSPRLPSADASLAGLFDPTPSGLLQEEMPELAPKEAVPLPWPPGASLGERASETRIDTQYDGLSQTVCGWITGLMPGLHLRFALLALAASSLAFVLPRQPGSPSSSTGTVAARPAVLTGPTSGPTGFTEELPLFSKSLSLVALAALVPAFVRRGGSSKVSAGKGIRCVAMQATKTKGGEIAKKSEVPEDLDWGAVSSQWEVDCFSRPVMRDGKKMWELMVTDANAVYRRVAQMKPTRVNSVVVQKLMTIFIEESKVKPQTIRFFRKVMKNMLIVALAAVKDTMPEYLEKTKIIPSRNCHMLRLWLNYRMREVYPKMTGYQPPAKKKSTSVQGSLVKMAYERLPERLFFTQFAMTAISLGALARVKPGQLPGQLARIPPGFSDSAQVYGILILTSRADGVAGLWHSTIRVDLETDDLLMELDIDTTWPTRFSERRGARYKIDKIRPEEKEVYLKFERSKRQLGGLHFVAVHDAVTGGEPLLPIEAFDSSDRDVSMQTTWVLERAASPDCRLWKKVFVGIFRVLHVEHQMRSPRRAIAVIAARAVGIKVDMVADNYRKTSIIMVDTRDDRIVPGLTGAIRRLCSGLFLVDFPAIPPPPSRLDDLAALPAFLSSISDDLTCPRCICHVKGPLEAVLRRCLDIFAIALSMLDWVHLSTIKRFNDKFVTMALQDTANASTPSAEVAQVANKGTRHRALMLRFQPPWPAFRNDVSVRWTCNPVKRLIFFEIILDDDTFALLQRSCAYVLVGAAGAAPPCSLLSGGPPPVPCGHPDLSAVHSDELARSSLSHVRCRELLVLVAARGGLIRSAYAVVADFTNLFVWLECTCKAARSSNVVRDLCFNMNWTGDDGDGPVATGTRDVSLEVLSLQEEVEILREVLGVAHRKEDQFLAEQAVVVRLQSEQKAEPCGCPKAAVKPRAMEKRKRWMRAKGLEATRDTSDVPVQEGPLVRLALPPGVSDLKRLESILQRTWRGGGKPQVLQNEPQVTLPELVTLWPKGLDGCVANFVFRKESKPGFTPEWEWIAQHLSHFEQGGPVSDKLWFTIGLHPHNAAGWDAYAEKIVRDFAAHPKCVGVGECGLDFFKHDPSEEEIQLRAFRAQAELAVELGKALVVHARLVTRENETRFLSELKRVIPQHHPIHIHCFGDSLEHAQELISHYPRLRIGFTGAITFSDPPGKGKGKRKGNEAKKGQEHCRELIQGLPLDRLLIETDGPYMCPEPFRGQTAHPGHVHRVAERIAEWQNVSLGAVMAATWQSTVEVYGLSCVDGRPAHKKKLPLSNAKAQAQEAAQDDEGAPAACVFLGRLEDDFLKTSNQSTDSQFIFGHFSSVWCLQDSWIVDDLSKGDPELERLRADLAIAEAVTQTSRECATSALYSFFCFLFVAFCRGGDSGAYSDKFDYGCNCGRVRRHGGPLLLALQRL
ncbi:TATDN2 [Symbiodinium microadriaticum]|nr:TATDN2 [Symbiodinium microadriaticum]